jgi:Rap1a immunity proteins
MYPLPCRDREFSRYCLVSALDRHAKMPPPMKYVPVLALFLFAFVFAPKTQSQPAFDRLETGNDFLRQCDEQRIKADTTSSVDPSLGLSHSMQWARCVGYVQGFLEGQFSSPAMFGVRSQSAANAKLGYCGVENLDFRQVAGKVVKWLKDNPAKDNLPVAAVMLTALTEALPCKK